MNLSEIYNEMSINDSWDRLQNALEETSILQEGGESKLQNLINEADKVIFPNFGIDPSEHKYFISGSAMLYVYPGLVEFINKVTTELNVKADLISLEPGDLDVVVPGKKEWLTLKNNMNGKVNPVKFKSQYSQGIFRPQELDLTSSDIESFNEWLPQKAGGNHVDADVDSTDVILSRAKLINGYYFMSLQDVLSYKYQLGRDKEIRITNLIDSYLIKREGRTQEDVFNIIARIVNMDYNKNKNKNKNKF